MTRDTPTIVYMAVNKISGKLYIGYTKKELRFRKTQHINDAAANRDSCRIFHAAIRKYGEENFGWFLLSSHSSKSDGLRAEIEAIAKYQPEYNISRGGQGTNGVPWTEDRKVQMRAFMKGRVMTPEQRDKWRKTYLEFGYGKKVICINDGLIYKSAAAASRHYGIKATSISLVCGGNIHTAGGKIFRFATDELSAMERDRIVIEVSIKRKEKQRGRPAGTWTHSQETRAKIARKNKGNKFHLGKKHTDKVKSLLRDLASTDEAKSRWKMYAGMGPKAMARPVKCLDTNEMFESASAAAAHFGVAKSALIELCLGQRYRKTVGGRKFSYVESAQ